MNPQTILWYETRNDAFGTRTGIGMHAFLDGTADETPALITVDATKFSDDQLTAIAKAAGFGVSEICRSETGAEGTRN